MYSSDSDRAASPEPTAAPSMTVSPGKPVKPPRSHAVGYDPYLSGSGGVSLPVFGTGGGSGSLGGGSDSRDGLLLGSGSELGDADGEVIFGTSGEYEDDDAELSSDGRGAGASNPAKKSRRSTSGIGGRTGRRRAAEDGAFGVADIRASLPRAAPRESFGDAGISRSSLEGPLAHDARDSVRRSNSGSLYDTVIRGDETMEQELHNGTPLLGSFHGMTAATPLHPTRPGGVRDTPAASAPRMRPGQVSSFSQRPRPLDPAASTESIELGPTGAGGPGGPYARHRHANFSLRESVDKESTAGAGAAAEGGMRGRATGRRAGGAAATAGQAASTDDANGEGAFSVRRRRFSKSEGKGGDGIGADGSSITSTDDVQSSGRSRSSRHSAADSFHGGGKEGKDDAGGDVVGEGHAARVRHHHQSSRGGASTGRSGRGGASTGRSGRGRGVVVSIPAAHVNPYVEPRRARLRRRRGQGSADADTTAGSISSHAQESSTRKRGRGKPMRIRTNGAAPSHFLMYFQELEKIGRGSFAEVLKCKGREDGCYYAVKRFVRPARGYAERELLLSEVHALAALSDCPHVVRYFSAWFEEERLYVQTELLDGTIEDVALGKLVLSLDDEVVSPGGHSHSSLLDTNSSALSQAVHALRGDSDDDDADGGAGYAGGVGVRLNFADVADDPGEGGGRLVGSPTPASPAFRRPSSGGLSGGAARLSKMAADDDMLDDDKSPGRDGVLGPGDSVRTTERGSEMLDSFVSGLDSSAYAGTVGSPERGTRRRLTEEVLSIVLSHVCSALHCMHRRGIAHLDVKPANILVRRVGSLDDATMADAATLTSGCSVVCKLADLGQAQPADGRTQPFDLDEGDARYVCDALLEGVSPSLSSADVFSLGVSLFELAMGAPLEDRSAWYPAALDSLPDMLPQLSAGFCDVLAAMMHPDPNCRPTVAELLEHPMVASAGQQVTGALRRGLNPLDELHVASPAALAAAGGSLTARSSFGGVHDISDDGGLVLMPRPGDPTTPRFGVRPLPPIRRFSSPGRERSAVGSADRARGYGEAKDAVPEGSPAVASDSQRGRRSAGSAGTRRREAGHFMAPVTPAPSMADLSSVSLLSSTAATPRGNGGSVPSLSPVNVAPTPLSSRSRRADTSAIFSPPILDGSLRAPALPALAGHSGDVSKSLDTTAMVGHLSGAEARALVTKERASRVRDVAALSAALEKERQARVAAESRLRQLERASRVAASPRGASTSRSSASTGRRPLLRAHRRAGHDAAAMR